MFVITMSNLTPIAYAELTTFAQVTKVTDGDSLEVVTNNKRKLKIRIASIDAPEYKQAYGKQSKRALSRLVLGKKIEIDCYKKDRYQRHICTIKDSKATTDIALMMVKSGNAWHYKRYADEQNLITRLKYTKAERSAVKRKLGLWQENDPTPPWIWRRKGKSSSQAQTTTLFDHIKNWLQ